MDSFKNKKSKDSMLLIYIKSIFKALIGIVVLFLVLALLMTYTSIPQSVIMMLAFVLVIFDLAFCGMQSAYNMRKNGFFNGLMSGTLYVFILVILSMALIPGFTLDPKLLIKAVSGILASGIGGMIGVNLS